MVGETLQSEWDAMIAAPYIFWGAVIVLSGVEWAVLHFLYRHRIDGLKDDLAREQRENAKLVAGRTEVPTRTSPARPTDSALANLPTLAEAMEGLRQPQPESERVYVSSDVSLEFLMSQFDDRTSHEGDRLVEPYIGKWMHLTGTVQEVGRDKHLGWNVALVGPDKLALKCVMLFFGDNESGKVELLRRGVTLTAVGQIQAIDRSSVRFDHCQVADPAST